MLYRVRGDRKTVRGRTVGTYRGYVHWVWVRCGYRYGYGTGMGRGYGLKTGTVGTLYQYAVPTGRTHVPYPYRTRTQKHAYTVPIPKARTYVPYRT